MPLCTTLISPLKENTLRETETSLLILLLHTYQSFSSITTSNNDIIKLYLSPNALSGSNREIIHMNSRI